MDVFLNIIALVFFAVALIGVLSLGLLAIIWGPAAAAAFATLVTLHQAGADGWTILSVTVLVFVVVRVLCGYLLRAGLRVLGTATHAQ